MTQQKGVTPLNGVKIHPLSTDATNQDIIDKINDIIYVLNKGKKPNPILAQMIRSNIIIK